MSDVYACSELVGNVCAQWVKVDRSFGMPNLTAEQASQIFAATALLFATAWIFREIRLYMKRY